MDEFHERLARVGLEETVLGGSKRPESVDLGSVRIACRYSSASFVYRFTQPICSTDFGERFEMKWGDNRLAMPLGEVHLTLWVPYLLPRKAGKVEVEVTVKDETQLEYVVPAFPLLPGAVGAPGTVKAVGVALAGKLNLATVAILVAGWIYVLLFLKR